MSGKSGETGTSGLLSVLEFANRKGYSGTAVFTRQEPMNVVNGIGIEEHDKEGRVITLEFEKFYLVTVLHPQFSERAEKTFLSDGMGKRFSGISSEITGEETCSLLR